MTSIGGRVVYKVFVAALLFLSGPARFQARALNEPALQFGGISRPPYASTQQQQDRIQDKSKADAAKRAFEQAEQLRNDGSAESRKKAVEKYDEALLLYRAVADRRGEATTLNNIGLVYRALGEKQKALDCYNQALPLRRAVGDRSDEATTLSNIGTVYHDLGEKQKALDYYNQVLPLKRAVGDLSGEAITLSNIGAVYHDLGEKQKALNYYNQALRLKRAVGDRSGEAATLNNIGVVYRDLGEKQKALDHYNQAVPLWRARGDRSGGATTLNNIGAVYRDLGEKQKALDYYNQALSLRRAVGDRSGEAKTLTELGEVYDAIGEKEKALDYYNQALPLRRAVGDRSGEATTLSNIGVVYHTLGEKQKALGYYNQALLLWRVVSDGSGEATALTNIGALYDGLGQKQKALDYFNQALPLWRAVGDRAGEAAVLNNIGMVYHDLGEKQKALDYFNQALPLRRAVGDRSGEAITLSNIGLVYDGLGENQKALDYYNQALRLSLAVGNRDSEATTLSNLMYSWKNNNSALAIFYGKQAVNAYQHLRARISGLNKEIQKTFLHSKEDTYRLLADLLISSGRLPEAQQVLGLLKEQEYFDFVRRDGAAASLTGVRITFTPAEAELEKRFGEIAHRIAEIGAQCSALLLIRQRTPQQEKRLSELEAQLEIANQAFHKFLDQLEAELKKAKPGSSDVATLREAQVLKDTLRELDSIALYTIVGQEKYNVILITPDVEKAYEHKISEADLNKKVFAFRELLQNPKADPLPRAKELYDLLIGPELSRDIAQTGRQTVLWSLDGALRYLPVAALHDGQRYLIESYRNVVITLASRDHLKNSVSPKWQALGLGVSKWAEIKELKPAMIFPPLPGVREELAGIVRDETRGGEQKGVLPGKVMLDADFTAEAMKTALRLRGNQQPFKLVHIASHFNFEQGDETKSFLLLGGGKMVTLAQLKSMAQIFSGVELLTLSACNTATGGEGEGKEVEGFAVLAQRQGAEAVIASLWKVADPSTSQLMQRFYRLRDERRGMSKAEAMRQAQLAFLRPEIQQVHVNDPKKIYAHPYFWAPFILIGNWK